MRLALRHEPGRGEKEAETRRQPQLATKPITINRSAAAHSAKSTRFERAATLDYAPASPRVQACTHVHVHTYLKREKRTLPQTRGNVCLSLRSFHSASLLPLGTHGIMVLRAVNLAMLCTMYVYAQPFAYTHMHAISDIP